VSSEAIPEYPNRPSALDKESRYLIRDGHLVRMEGEEVKGLYPLSETRSLRLRFFPTRVQLSRYECHVQIGQKPALKLVNEYYEGPMDFRDQNAAYREFVKTLIREIRASGANAEFQAGTTQGAYCFNVGCAIFVLIALFLGAVVLFFWVNSAIALAKLLILLIFLPTMLAFLKKNKPTSLDPENLPSSVLPD